MDPAQISSRFFKWMYLNKYIFLIIALFSTNGISQPSKEILDLDQIIKVALENNEQLQAYYYSTNADSVKISYSGALPDPVLSLNLLNVPTNSFAFDQDPMTGKQISLRQVFPFPGKLSLNEQISSESFAISRANYSEYRNQIIKEIKTIYYDMFYIDKALEINTRNQMLLGEFAHIAQTKYAVGNGLQHDVLNAQVEYSRMKDVLAKLEQRRREKQFELNSILNSPLVSDISEISLPEFQEMNISADTLKALAETYRPLLMAWTAIKKQSVLKTDLAKKDYWPDFGVFIAYTQRDMLQNGLPGDDLLSGGISFNIPVYSGSKQSKKVEESQYLKKMSENRHQQIRNLVHLELENSLSNSENNVELINLYKTEILPQAAQSVESALVGYKTDQAEFLTLMSSQISLVNYELDYYRALCDYHKDIANLEFLTGKNLIKQSE